MASDSEQTLDPEYPNLPAEVVDAWRNAPENVVAEIIDGELSTMPRPSPRHASRPRPDLVVPDLAGWRRERLPTMPTNATIDVVPDWVCEVRSPSTQRHDRFKKMPMYLRHGVGHAWMVDPEAQGLEVFRRTADG